MKMMKNKYIIAEYDLEDNIIDCYENYEELAKKWTTSVKSLRCEVSRIKSGKINCCYDKIRNIPVRLYKIEMGEKDE